VLKCRRFGGGGPEDDILDIRLLELNEADMAEATRLAGWIRLTGRQIVRVLLVLLVVLLAIGSVRQQSFWNVVRGALVPIVLLPVIYLPILWLTARYQGRRQLRQNRSLQGPIELSWDDEAYEARAATFHTRTPWRHYVKWAENERMILMYHSDHMPQILPKRVLREGDAAAIRGHLAAAGVPHAGWFR
jgi:hypothetical protein